MRLVKVLIMFPDHNYTDDSRSGAHWHKNGNGIRDTVLRSSGRLSYLWSDLECNEQLYLYVIPLVSHMGSTDFATQIYGCSAGSP